MKVKVTLETILELTKEELRILKESDSMTVIATAVLQDAPVEVKFTTGKKD